MRKFQKRGKISRKKMMRKVASGEQRQLENEFIAKCFTSSAAVEDESKKQIINRTNLKTNFSIFSIYIDYCGANGMQVATQSCFL